ncbi:MAG: hypothetical protein V4677_16320 [Bacteroidota bacterium]
MTKFIKLCTFLLVIILVSNCNNPGGNIKAGSICTIQDGEGKFGVVKVLVIDGIEAHVKIYKNKFDQRPSVVDMKTLSLGSINDTDGFGMGHVPLAREGFDAWNPVMIGYEEVTKEDLEGYEIWRNQQ